MSQNFQGRSDWLTEYLQSAVKLEAVDTLTKQMTTELSNSQRIMDEIKVIFDSIPNTQSDTQNPSSNGRNHENLSTFLDAEVPNLLMPDMVNDTADRAYEDLDNVIATMKRYAEDLKKNVLVQPTSGMFEQQNIDNLNLAQYASSLSQLSKSLGKVKLPRRNEVDTRNSELEAKLAQLCQDVKMFTQMVETKKTLGECSQSRSPPQPDNGVQYEEIITKLLSGLNELTFLLQNNH